MTNSPASRLLNCGCSIIIPVFNRAKYIGRAIQSVISQTISDWELIVVDDCSTDYSLQVAKSFQGPQIIVLQTTGNSGAAAARNLGIQFSSGKFISFLDSDDAYETSFLEESVRKFNSLPLEVGMIWTGLRYLKKEGAKLRTEEQIWRPDISDPYKLFLSDLRIGTNSGITIRREVFDKVGLFDESLRAAEDTDLFLRISKVYNVDYLDKVLINIYQGREDHLSKRFDKIAKAYNIIIPKHLATISLDKNLRLKYFYKAMWLNYHLGNTKLARNSFKKVLTDKYFFLRAWGIVIIFEFLGKKLGAALHIRLSTASKFV